MPPAASSPTASAEKNGVPPSGGAPWSFEFLRERLRTAPVAVPVPEWGGEVFYLIAMPSRLKALYQADLRARSEAAEQAAGPEGETPEERLRRVERERNRDFQPYLVALCLCDPEGRLLLDADDPEHIEWLASLHGGAVDRLALKAMRINGMLEDDVEGAEKNSGSSPSSGS